MFANIYLEGLSMSRRNKRKLQILVFILAAVICTGFFMVRSCVIVANAGTEDTTSNYKYYTSVEIQHGDSLWSIAETYMTDEYDSIQDYIEEIKEINHIKGDQIDQGSYLCVPYYSAELK